MGKVFAIFISPDKGEPMIRVTTSIKAIEGQGLEGDRYQTGKGAYSNSKRKVIRHVTLIAIEVIENTDFSMEQTRRNIITTGINLNNLVGKEFTVGNVRLRGIELADPCDRPSQLSGKPDFKSQFDNAGGLRAQILTTGQIKPGDEITT